MNLTNLYIIAGFFAVVVFALFYFVFWRKDSHKKLKEKQVEEKEGTIPVTPDAECRIYDTLTRTIYNQTLKGTIVDEIRKKHTNMGRKWNYYGNLVYAIEKKYAGNDVIEYNPVVPPILMEIPPSKLFRALVKPWIAIRYNVQQPQNFLQKWGMYLLFGGVAVFFLFILVAQQMQ
jgi:hypothetical protein